MPASMSSSMRDSLRLAPIMALNGALITGIEIEEGERTDWRKGRKEGGREGEGWRKCGREEEKEGRGRQRLVSI